MAANVFESWIALKGVCPKQRRLPHPLGSYPILCCSYIEYEVWFFAKKQKHVHCKEVTIIVMKNSVGSFDIQSNEKRP